MILQNFLSESRIQILFKMRTEKELSIFTKEMKNECQSPMMFSKLGIIDFDLSSKGINQIQPYKLLTF